MKTEVKEEVKNMLAIVLLVVLLLCAFFVIMGDPIVALNVAISGLVFLAGRWAVVRIWRRWFSYEAFKRGDLPGVVVILIALIPLLMWAVMSRAQYTQNPYTTTPTTMTYNPGNTGFDNQLTGNYYYNSYNGGMREWITNNIWLWSAGLHGLSQMFDRSEDPGQSIWRSGSGKMPGAQP